MVRPVTILIGCAALTLVGCGSDEETPLVGKRRIEVPLETKVRRSLDLAEEATRPETVTAGLSEMASAPTPDPIRKTVLPTTPAQPVVKKLPPLRTLARGYSLRAGPTRVTLLETRVFVDEHGDQHDAGRFSVSYGRKSYVVDAWAEKSVRVGANRLDVVSVAGDTVRYRWHAKRGDVVRQISDQDGLVRLTEMGFYQLPDKSVIAVGNVLTARQGAGAGVANRPRVTVGIYPANYETDPLMGYDLYARVTEASRLRGSVRRAVLRRVAPATEGEPLGYVELVFIDS